MNYKKVLLSILCITSIVQQTHASVGLSSLRSVKDFVVRHKKKIAFTSGCIAAYALRHYIFSSPVPTSISDFILPKPYYVLVPDFENQSIQIIKKIPELLSTYVNPTPSYWNFIPYKKSIKAALGIMGGYLVNKTVKKTIEESFTEEDFSPEEKQYIGCCNGLSVSHYGGNVIQCKATLKPGSGQLYMYTGLGLASDTKESARKAFAYIQAHAAEFNIPDNQLLHHDIEIKFLRNGMPINVDGASAGAAILTAMVSALREQPTHATCAMTGTIELDGTIGAIGGLREKINGALAHGMTNVLYPQANWFNLIGSTIQNIGLTKVNHASTVLGLSLLDYACYA